MCRNIKQLYNFEPPATKDEIHIASLQFIKKVSGFNKPSKANEDSFNKAVKEIEEVVSNLFDNLTTKAKSKNREIEAEKAKKRFEKRIENLKSL